MLRFKRVIIGISGGVDSAVAALLLKNKGYDLHAVFMQNWDITDETGVCQADVDYKDAQILCDKLGIPLSHVNFVKDYWHDVFSELLLEYRTGRTPNPDILCNRFVKFDKFYTYAMERLNGDAIATGHYAKTNFGPYLEAYSPTQSVQLHRGLDEVKDQTFFLSQVSQHALSRTMFPLGNLLKSQVKEIARENGLRKFADRKESMGICFIGSRNFKNFITDYIVNSPGDFVDVDTGKIVGQHLGIHHWTLGQRSKLAGLHLRSFICRKCTQSNTIFVAKGTDHPVLHTRWIFTSHPHWIGTEPKELTNNESLDCLFTFQHTHSLIKSQVLKTNKGLIINLSEDKRAVTPGQYAVLYQGTRCLGSAKIVSAGPSNFTLNWLANNSYQNVYKQILCN